MALDRFMRRETEARLGGAAQRAQLLIDQSLADREREVGVLALNPAVVDAAREGGARAASLKLAETPAPELEQRFTTERSLQVAAATRTSLLSALPRLDAADVSITEGHGFNVLTTRRSSDFVQSDEAWWQSAWQDGLATSATVYDSTLHTSVVHVAAVVKDGTNRLGVVTLAFPAAPLASALEKTADGVRIDVVDSTNRILLSTDSVAMGHFLSGMSGQRSDAEGVSAVFDAGAERVVGAVANRGRWHLVAHQSSAALSSPYRNARLALVGVVAVLLVVLLGVLLAVHQFLARRISGPATELAVAAEAVAAGDFSIEIVHSSSDDEIGRLGRAIGAMLLELRRLAQALATSASETTLMSSEITAGSEEMAATAGEIANTASDLSAQATSMAETIGSLAQSASSLKDLATTLDDGARGGSARNTSLRELALENRAGLDASVQSLSVLGNDVVASAQAIESLGAASE